MPVLGMGTWKLTGKPCEKAVRWGLELGYTHIDTSDDYMNEEWIGKAIWGLDRSRLFITSKVDDSKLHRNDLIQSCKETLEKLGTKYVDLYLIHRLNPTVPIEESMEAMEELVKRSRVRSVGISNFNIAGIQRAIKATQVPVCNNQIKIHPYHYPSNIVEYCKKNGIVVTAYSPLDTGEIVDDDLLTQIGKKYRRSAPQVSLRWLLENGLIVIPKASSKNHLIENRNIFNWNLSDEDSAKLTQSSRESWRG